MASIDKRPNKHSKKTWRARVRVKGFPDKTRSFDTREGAVKWASRVEMQLLAGEDTVPDLSSEMTLEEALDKYKEEETPNKKGSVQEGRRIEAWKKHPLAKKKLSLLTPQHFVEYRKERLKSVSKNTVRLDLSLISVLLKVAKDEWGMPYLANPVSLRKLSTSKGRDRRLPLSPGWFIAPVVVAAVADWTENIVQLVQLAQVRAHGTEALNKEWIHVASIATVTKLLFLSSSLLLVLCLSLRSMEGSIQHPDLGAPPTG